MRTAENSGRPQRTMVIVEDESYHQKTEVRGNPVKGCDTWHFPRIMTIISRLA